MYPASGNHRQPRAPDTVGAPNSSRPFKRPAHPRWRTWWKFVRVDQIWLWAGGCFVGMFLNVILASALIPPGTELSGLEAGAYQAEYLREKGGAVLGFLALLNGFWILFGSQLVVTDAFVRLSTDILWSNSPKIRRIAKDDIRRVYYFLVIGFATWGCIAISVIPKPDTLVKIAANVAGFIFVVVGIHVLVVHNTLMPKEVRAPKWQQGIICLSVIFFGFFAVMNVLRLVGL